MELQVKTESPLANFWADSKKVDHTSSTNDVKSAKRSNPNYLE
jgi:hypothetical protein